jgi:hypothetical protein
LAACINCNAQATSAITATTIRKARNLSRGPGRARSADTVETPV